MVRNPMESPPGSNTPGGPELLKAKQGLTGSLQCLCITRPEIATPLKLLAQAKPSQPAVQGPKRTIRYLRTPRCMLFRSRRREYGSALVLAAWTDSDWAGPPSRAPNPGVSIAFAGNPILFKSQAQHGICTSLAEAEAMAAREGSNHETRLKNLAPSLMPQFRPITSKHLGLQVPLPLLAGNQGELQYGSPRESAYGTWVFETGMFRTLSFKV